MNQNLFNWIPVNTPHNRSEKDILRKQYILHCGSIYWLIIKLFHCEPSDSEIFKVKEERKRYKLSHKLIYLAALFKRKEMVGTCNHGDLKMRLIIILE